MIGIYVLVSLLCHFGPQTYFPSSLASSPEADVFLSAQFGRIDGIKIGSAVLAEGQRVGTVAQIQEREAARRTSDQRASKTGSDEKVLVQLKISPEHRAMLREGTVALLASPLSAAKTQGHTIVELLLPERSSAPVLKDGANISGFSSYKEFWSAETSLSSLIDT